MTDQRERFEQWWDATDFTNSGPWAHDTPIQWAWDAWQAATAAAEADKWAAVRRCAQVAGPEDSYQDEHFKAKADAVRRIKAEFPDAFPVDPNAWAISRGLEST